MFAVVSMEMAMLCRNIIVNSDTFKRVRTHPNHFIMFPFKLVHWLHKYHVFNSLSLVGSSRTDIMTF